MHIVSAWFTMMELSGPDWSQEPPPERGYVFSTFGWDSDSPESIRQFMSARNIPCIAETAESEGRAVLRFFVQWKSLYIADVEVPGTILIFEHEPTMRVKALQALRAN